MCCPLCVRHVDKCVSEDQSVVWVLISHSLSFSVLKLEIAAQRDLGRGVISFLYKFGVKPCGKRLSRGIVRLVESYNVLDYFDLFQIN